MKSTCKNKNLCRTKYRHPKHKDHIKIRLFAPRYEMTPNQTKSHQDEIVYQKKKNHTKMPLMAPRYEKTPNKITHTRRKISQGDEKSYQESVDRIKV